MHVFMCIYSPAFVLSKSVGARPPSHQLLEHKFKISF